MERSRATARRGREKERIVKLQRWLDLITLLLHRRMPVSAEEVLSCVPDYARTWTAGDKKGQASARRAFERDKEELRAFGVRIETVEDAVPVDGERHAGYRLAKRGLYLPVLRLVAADDLGRPGAGPAPADHVDVRYDEARIVIEGLRHVASLPGHILAGEARSALRKLTFDFGRFAFPRAPVFIAPPAGAVADPATLSALLEAVRAGRRVRFRYRGITRNSVTRRVVAPYALLFLCGRWHLVGNDATRRSIRTFRVSRIESIESNNGTVSEGPEFDVPVDFDPSAYRGREAWELGDGGAGTAVRVLLHPPASLDARRRGLGDLVEERADGSELRAFVVHDEGAFLRWALAWRGAAEILEPASLRSSMHDVARSVARLHAPSPPPPMSRPLRDPPRRRQRAHE